MTQAEIEYAQRQNQDLLGLMQYATTQDPGNAYYANGILRAFTGNGQFMPDGTVNPLYGLVAPGANYLRHTLFGDSSQSLMAGIYQSMSTGGFNLAGTSGLPTGLFGHSTMVTAASRQMFDAVQGHFLDSAGRGIENRTGGLSKQDLGGLFQQISGVGGFSNATFELDPSGGVNIDPESLKGSLEWMEKWAKTIGVLKQTYRDKNIGQLMQMATDMSGLTIGMDDPTILQQRLQSTALSAQAFGSTAEYGHRALQAAGVISGSVLAQQLGGRPEDYASISGGIAFYSQDAMWARRAAGSRFGDNRYRQISDEEEASIRARNSSIVAQENDTMLSALLMKQSGTLDAGAAGEVDSLMEALRTAKSADDFRAYDRRLSGLLDSRGGITYSTIRDMSIEDKIKSLSATSSDYFAKQAIDQSSKRVRWALTSQFESYAAESGLGRTQHGNFDTIVGAIGESFGFRDAAAIDSMVAAYDRDGEAGLREFFNQNKDFLSKDVTAESLAAVIAGSGGYSQKDFASLMEGAKSYASLSRVLDGTVSNREAGVLRAKKLEQMLRNTSRGGASVPQDGLMGLAKNFAEGVIGMPKPISYSDGDLMAAMVNAGLVAPDEMLLGAEGGMFSAAQLEKMGQHFADKSKGSLLDAMKVGSYAELASRLITTDKVGNKSLNTAAMGELRDILASSGLKFEASGGGLYVGDSDSISRAQSTTTNVLQRELQANLLGSQVTDGIRETWVESGPQSEEEKAAAYQKIFDKDLAGMIEGERGHKLSKTFGQLATLYRNDSSSVVAALDKEIEETRTSASKEDAAGAAKEDSQTKRMQELEDLRGKLISSGQSNMSIRVDNWQEGIVTFLNTVMSNLQEKLPNNP